jgi:flagella basal body P-ring formation protein FlgA
MMINAQITLRARQQKKAITRQLREWIPKSSLLSAQTLAMILAGLVVSTSVFASTPKTPIEVKNLDAQIGDWSQAQFEQTGAYTFATQDRRLQVPRCKNFTFSSNASATKPKSSFMVNVACAEAGWSRFIRAKATEQVIIKTALIDVLTPRVLIEAGKPISAKDFSITQLPPHRTPQGALDKLDASAQWFSTRRMRPGYIVTAKDLRQPKRVLVVNKALPAGTLLTKQSFDIEERAVNLPRDAITSMHNIENLAASKLLHPGDILRRRDLTKGKLIRRGENVALLSQGLSYAISSQVVALEDGFLGEQIRLLNPEGQRRVSAIVTGASKAKTLSTK